MSSSVSGLVKLLIGALGLTPTLVGLFAAGIMIGKAKPCEGTAPCRAVAYGAEVLLIPIGTAVPFICGYLLTLVPVSPKKQKQSSASILRSGVRTDG
jgi:hypothetical protein